MRIKYSTAIWKNDSKNIGYYLYDLWSFWGYEKSLTIPSEWNLINCHAFAKCTTNNTEVVQASFMKAWFGHFRQWSVFRNFLFFYSYHILRTAVFEYCGYWVLRFLSTADTEYDQNFSFHFPKVLHHPYVFRNNSLC